MSRALLITGATGQQGGAVIDALLAKRSEDFTILAVTRNAESAAAQRLASKSPLIRIVEGDLGSVPSLFSSAKTAAGTASIWGVYSVQVSMGKGASLESEVQQGTALVDESIKNGVRHFVYSSVERGGDERSWDNPTVVPHFITKHKLEHHLRDSAAKSDMGWTILRPVAFMDNLQPGFPGKVFLTALRNTLQGKPLQWVATSDIGFFGAEAFHNPAAWDKKAVGLAGDELTFTDLSKKFEVATGSPAGTTFGVFGTALKYGVKELGTMINWFRDEGYRADIAALRKVHPGLMNMETWLKTKSAFVERK